MLPQLLPLYPLISTSLQTVLGYYGIVNLRVIFHTVLYLPEKRLHHYCNKAWFGSENVKRDFVLTTHYYDR